MHSKKNTCITQLEKNPDDLLQDLVHFQLTAMSLHSRFVSCIQLFLQYDSVCPQGVTQQVTHRVAPLLTGTTYGDNVRLLNSVIQVCHTGFYYEVYEDVCQG